MQRRRFCEATLALGAAAWAPGRAGASGDTALYDGAFALSGQTARARAKLAVRFHSPTDATLLITESALDGKQLDRFDVEMTKRMHLIAVSDDLRAFQHLHPEPNAAGVFAQPFRVPPGGGGYQFYADAVPHGLGQQVFRFAVDFGTAKAAAPDLTPTPRTVHAGPYAVTLGSLELAAGSPTMLSVRVTKNGAPANDLHPYLGGAAHAVFVDAQTLAYIHVHPEATSMRGRDMPMGMGMDMGEPPELGEAAQVSPAMMLHVVAPARGAYKLWLQFRGGANLYVAPFVLTAR